VNDNPPPVPVDLSRVVIDAASVKLLAYGFCKKKRVVVLGRVDPEAATAVMVGMAEVGDAELLSTLQSFLHRPIEAVPMRPADLLRALDAGYGIVADVGAQPALAVDGAASLVAGDPIDACVLDLLQRARGEGATVVHVMPWSTGLALRARVGGVLRPMASPIAPEQAALVIDRLCELAELPPSEGPAVARGSFRLQPADAEGVPTVVAVARAPSPHGPEVVLTFARPVAPRKLDTLGLETTPHELICALLAGRDGLVLVAGPGRSGRTTTLTAMVAELDCGRRRVVALCDVVSAVPGVDVRSPTTFGGDLASAIAGAEALDADVLVLDDLRDEAAWTAAVQAAEHGRLVLATTHAVDAVGGITSLDRAGVSRPATADLLRGVVAPRLLSRLCPNCRTAGDNGEWTAVGCDACASTGSEGEAAVFEVLWITPGLADRVAAGANTSEIRTQAIADGLRTLLDSAAALVDGGVVSRASVRAGLPLRLLQ